MSYRRKTVLVAGRYVSSLFLSLSICLVHNVQSPGIKGTKMWLAERRRGKLFCKNSIVSFLPKGADERCHSANLSSFFSLDKFNF